MRPTSFPEEKEKHQPVVINSNTDAGAVSGDDSPNKLVIKKKRAGPKLSINLYNTQYPVLEDCAKNLGFKIKMTDPNLYVNPYTQQDLNGNPI
jgi:hypothetical protein